MQTTVSSDDAAPNTRRKSKVLFCLLIVVVGIVLFAGLQPYGSFKDNWVSFTMETGETNFGDYGLVIGELPEFVENAARQNSLKMLVTPIIHEPTTSDFHVFAQLDSPNSDTPFILGQWKTSFIAINGHDRRGELELPRASANLSRHIGVPTEISYTFGPSETIVELDGKYENSGPAFDFSDPLTRITLGNSPDGKFGWYGRVANVTFVDINNPDRSISYRFDRNTHPTIQADTLVSTNKNLDLTVPAPGGFPEKAWIGSLKFNELLDNNKFDIVVNFLGFAPFGFLFTAFLLIGGKKTHSAIALVVTTFIGFLLSFGIESVQTFIPGRNPHVHDLFLNTTGTLFGSIGLLTLAGIWMFLRKPKIDERTQNINIEL